MKTTYQTHTADKSDQSPLWAEIIMVILWVSLIPILSFAGALLS